MANFPFHTLYPMPLPNRQSFGASMINRDDMIHFTRSPRNDHAFNMFCQNYNLLIDEDEESVGGKQQIVQKISSGTRKRRHESTEIVEPFITIKHQKMAENMRHSCNEKSNKLNSFGLNIASLTQAAKNIHTATYTQSTKIMATAEVMKSQDSPSERPRSPKPSKTWVESCPEKNSESGRKWYQRFQELLQFKKFNGHCDVPRSCKKLKHLSIWVSNQRQFCKRVREEKPSQITKQRIELLDQIGFNWSLNRNPQEKWQERYEQLKDYKKKHGHCNVPQTKPEYQQLSNWVNWQRYVYKKSSISQKHIEDLEKIGFKWSPDRKIGDKWLQKYNELVEYKKTHGHCNVPQRHENVRKLGIWVTHQRNFYRRLKHGLPTQIAEERIKALEKIGFEWYPDRKLKVNWQEKYEQLIEYKKKYGHCDVPRNNKDNKQLGTWVNGQRYFYRRKQAGVKSYITDERIELLEKIGFRWTMKKKS